jgi:hypothetical protein
MNKFQKIRLLKKNDTENDFQMKKICPFEEKIRYSQIPFIPNLDS